jgi:hypothetical protein
LILAISTKGLADVAIANVSKIIPGQNAASTDPVNRAHKNFFSNTFLECRSRATSSRYCCQWPTSSTATMKCALQICENLHIFSSFFYIAE